MRLIPGDQKKGVTTQYKVYFDSCVLMLSDLNVINGWDTLDDRLLVHEIC